MNSSEKLTRLSLKSERPIGVLPNLNKSSVISRKLRDSAGEKIEKSSIRRQNSLLHEVTPGEENASFLERQLSLPCLKPNFQPIALFEEANLEKSRPSYVFGEKKSQSDQNSLNIEIQDHNYSGIKMNYNLRSEYQIGSPKASQFHNYSSPPSSQKEKSSNQITNINDLKRITPRVKLLNQDTPTLQPIKKLNPLFKPVIFDTEKSNEIKRFDETAKRELKKYCRTCAGVKLPLVDIFSEKGIQMKLNQQIKHLENINENDSLSTQMCMDCICDLKMSYTFFMQIKKAESKLKSIHSKLIETSKSVNLKIKEEVSKISNPPLIQHDPANLKNNGPRISAVFSTKDSMNWETESDISKLDLSISKLDSRTLKVETGISKSDSGTTVKSEPKMVKEVQSENESIEEFDPDDPPFNPESEEDLDSDGEPRKVFSPFKKTFKKLHEKKVVKEEDVKIDLTKEIQIDLTKDKAYTYDKNLKAYVKMDTSEGKEPKNMQKESEGQSLKRKIQDRNENLKLKTIGKDAKIRKFNVNEALNIKTEENGVMYVTVRGAKPNELLLVKVKKMEKADKSKIPKKPDAKEKEKDPFVDRSLEEKGQIIEEQIEEYKKKREKVLGPVAKELISEELSAEVRVKMETETEENKVEENEFPKEIPEIPVLIETPTPKQIQMTEVHEIKEEKFPEKCAEKSPKPIVLQKNKEKAKPVDIKVYNNPEDYNFRIETAKNKWEDKQRKDWEETHPGVENPVDRLKRILGETAKGENLQEFLENLQQRKMVISRLNDDDIISLFQDRIVARKSFSEAEEEQKEVPLLELFDCDFCFGRFPTKEICEEHMKVHDVKIQYFCEDCDEEFPVLRLKKNHNVICIKKLICKHCDLMLDSKGKKKQHEQKHCDSLFGQICEFCGEKFKHQGTLDQHVKTKHLSFEKVFQCSKCPKKFAFKTKLSFHLKSVHTSLRAYLCEDCGADFKNPASLRHHRIRKHLPIGNKRECPVCRKMVPFYSLSKHMHTHKAYTIKCPHCDKMFKNTSTLKQHVRIHEDQRQFRCDTCGVGFNRRDGLRLHMKVHQKSDSRGLKECSCQVCGEKFPNHSMLVIHRNRVHKDGRNYTCHICNRSMISTRSLEWHLAHIHNQPLPGIVKTETESGAETKRVQCFHCHKTFKTEMILRTHVKNSHMQKEPVKCLDCEETFLSEVRLRHHMMIAHNRLEGTLQCPHCPKRFVNQLRLKTHMIAHSEERPFKCDICGFNLKTKIQLIKHHQNRHSDERPLQCRYCPWRCKQVSALVCHERTHTNERPYSCSVCRQRFKYLGDKNKHERRHESLGGAGFKRIVTNRGPKKNKSQQEEEADTSNSEQEQLEEEMETLEMEARLVDVAYEVEEESVKLEETIEDVDNENEYSNYQQDYEETSREASEAAEVIMSMEDATVYTEEVTAENIETTHIIEDEMMANQILHSGTVVHIEQQDEEGKIQMIPVVLSLPDLAEENSEVNLATASIMYNNEEE